MAVIVRKRVTFGDRQVELEVYQPEGLLSKEDRLRADRLDDLLKRRLPEIATEVIETAGASSDVVRRWYLLGKELREVVDDRELVAGADVSDGLVWLAIWQYLPDSMKPKGAKDATPYVKQQHKRKDHLSLCYEISGFEWSHVQWIRRWDDWNQLAFRPGLLRDQRIVLALGRRVSRLSKYPSRREFREILKMLGDAFPTRRFRDSSLLGDPQIDRTVREVVERVAKNAQ